MTAPDLLVRGWAAGRGRALSYVDVWLDDAWLGRAGLGRPRPDVGEALGDIAQSLSGFELLARIPRRLSGDVALRVVATFLDGGQLDFPPIVLTLRIGDPADANRSAQEVGRGPKDVGRTRALRPRRTSPIRILWSARGLDLGGSQLRMAELLAYLHERGDYQSTVFSPTDGALRPAIEAAGAEIEVTNLPPVDDPEAYEAALKELEPRVGDRFDLVVGATASAFPLIDLATRMSVPAALRIGEAVPIRTLVTWLNGQLDEYVEACARRAVAAASIVISNSEAAVAAYRADGCQGRFEVVPTGVDIDAVRSRRRALDRQRCREILELEDDDVAVVCAASVWPLKGQALLAMAADLLRAKHPNLVVLFVGVTHFTSGEGPIGIINPSYAHSIETYVDGRGLQRSVRMVAHQRDLLPVWVAADAAVVASECESLPSVAVEAMAAGLPVLASSVGDLPRLIQHGRTGWVYHHSHLGSLMSSLDLVASTSRAARQQMGDAAARRVARNNDRNTTFRRTERLLRAAVKSRQT